MDVLVGVPIIRDARRFHVEKGRRWSVFEHVVLEALAKKNYSADELCSAGALPRRVVIEIIIRLMRSGWVEVHNTKETITFAATSIGRAMAVQKELPPATEIKTKYIGFAVDLVFGSIFYSRDLVAVRETDWVEKSKGKRSIILKQTLADGYNIPSMHALADVLLQDDEEIASVDIREWKPSKRLAVVSVNKGKISGFGGEISDELERTILEASRQAAPSSAKDLPVKWATPATSAYRSAEYPQRQLDVRANDMLVSPNDHANVPSEIAKVARSRIIVHSTFIDFAKAVSFLDQLRPALNRGVKVDILWGQSSEKSGVNATRKAADLLSKHVSSQGIGDRVWVQPFTTGSHSKILLYDAGDQDKYVAVVGSCNWLSSGFQSVETSVRLRGHQIVSDVAFELAELVKPQDGNITDKPLNYARLARRLAQKGPQTGKSTARLILGHQHGNYVLRARDESRSSIMLTSHRLGVAAKPVLISLATAASARGIQPEVYFGRYNSDVDATTAGQDIFEFRDAGVSIKAVNQPRIHGKALIWDEHDVVLTSNNWLSSDPSPNSPHQELGIHLSGPRLGSILRERFHLSLF